MKCRLPWPYQPELGNEMTNGLRKASRPGDARPGGQLQRCSRPRSAQGGGWGTPGPPRAFWVNPVSPGNDGGTTGRRRRPAPHPAAGKTRLPRDFGGHPPSPVVFTPIRVASLTECPSHSPNWLSLRFSKIHSNRRNRYSGICSHDCEGNLTDCFHHIALLNTIITSKPMHFEFYRGCFYLQRKTSGFIHTGKMCREEDVPWGNHLKSRTLKPVKAHGGTRQDEKADHFSPSMLLQSVWACLHGSAQQKKM